MTSTAATASAGTATTSTPLPTGVAPGTWQIETSHSSAAFSVRHAGISKVRGTIAITGGRIVIGDDLESSTVEATLDPATVDTRDERRDGHLRSADFFETETYPTWEFRSTGIRADGEDYLIDGELTAHGVTRPVTLRTEFNGGATDPFGAARLGASATTTISRKEFGLTWNAALETGGVLVSDTITISLDIEAVAAE
jgi:polyisoprenoid-binding protein YceI